MTNEISSDWNYHRYLFPDNKLLEHSTASLREMIAARIDQACEMSDGSNFNADINIDFAQDMIEQARDIILMRGEGFSDDEKHALSFLRWP